MGAYTSSRSISFELNGESFDHELETYGNIEDPQYFKTYGSDVPNAAIVVNKVLIYGIRLIYVDKRKNCIVVWKICDQPSKEDVKKAIQIIKNGLQSEYGILCFNGIYKSDDMKVGGTLCIHPRKLEEFYLTELIWWTEPLEHTAARVIGGKHSKIEAKFEHNIAYPPVSVNVVVERMQNGVFLASFNSCKGYDRYASASAKQENTKHFGVNLEQFLSDCNAENESSPYQLDSNDCHCFAQKLWRRYVPSKFLKKPNEKLTKIGSALFNNFLPSASSGVQNQIEIQSVKPNHEDDEGVLQRLGISAEAVYGKRYVRKCKQESSGSNDICGFNNIWRSNNFSFLLP